MLDGIPLTALTAPALLGITILLLLFGRLVPRSTLEQKIKEADKWQEAYETERETRIASVAQTAELLEVTKTTHSIVAAVFGVPQARQAGEAYVVPQTKEQV